MERRSPSADANVQPLKPREAPNVAVASSRRANEKRKRRLEPAEPPLPDRPPPSALRPPPSALRPPPSSPHSKIQNQQLVPAKRSGDGSSTCPGKAERRRIVNFSIFSPTAHRTFSPLDTLRHTCHAIDVTIASTSASGIREDVLRDPRYPVSRIADQLRPYLQVLVEQFHPERVILFGSYAYGEPTEDSDVDLLVVKDIDKSPVSEATRIRRAVRHLRHTVSNLPLDIMVRAPEDLRQRMDHGADFHEEIVRKGLVLI